MRESYAIRINRNLLPPEYLPGYNNRADVEEYLQIMEREPGAIYSIVYVREYLNRARDRDGNFTISTIAELPDPNN